MVTQSKSDVMASGPGQQQTMGGKRGGSRPLRGVAIIGALVLAFVASQALGRALYSGLQKG
jgi:hypothetical protein